MRKASALICGADFFGDDDPGADAIADSAFAFNRSADSASDSFDVAPFDVACSLASELAEAASVAADWRGAADVDSEEVEPESEHPDSDANNAMALRK
jgi:hypothetical protein